MWHNGGPRTMSENSNICYYKELCFVTVLNNPLHEMMMMFDDDDKELPLLVIILFFCFILKLEACKF